MSTSARTATPTNPRTPPTLNERTRTPPPPLPPEPIPHNTTLIIPANPNSCVCVRVCV
jgi:hypothetical protein